MHDELSAEGSSRPSYRSKNSKTAAQLSRLLHYLFQTNSVLTSRQVPTLQPSPFALQQATQTQLGEGIYFPVPIPISVARWYGGYYTPKFERRPRFDFCPVHTAFLIFQGGVSSISFFSSFFFVFSLLSHAPHRKAFLPLIIT